MTRIKAKNKAPEGKDFKLLAAQVLCCWSKGSVLEPELHELAGDWSPTKMLATGIQLERWGRQLRLSAAPKVGPSPAHRN